MKRLKWILYRLGLLYHPTKRNSGARRSATPTRNIVGDLTITTPGTHLDRLDIRGNVYVRAANCTMTGCIIRGSVKSGAASRDEAAIQRAIASEWGPRHA